MHLEPASLADLGALESLETASFPPALALKRRHLRYLLRRPTAAVYVLRNGRSVAAEIVVLFRRSPAGTVARIYSLAVDPARRRAGMGRVLLDATLETLARRGVREARLEVDPANAPAVALYAKAGFQTIARLADYYAPGIPAIRMRLAFTRGAGSTPRRGGAAPATARSPNPCGR